MAEIDPVILELRAELGRYKADLRSTTTSVEQMLGRQEKSAKRLEAEMKRSSGAIGATLTGLAGTLAAAFTGRELVGLIDSFTRFQNQLKVAGLEGEALLAVQERLYALGTRYGVSVNALGELYGKAAQAAGELGASQDQLLSLTEAVSQSILITGTTTEQASGAILGLSQALAGGTVRAEEFNQINEGGLRPLLEAAAASDRFGGSVAKLRAAVLDGKVSSQEFYQAILANADLLEGQAAKATLTLSGAFTALTDQIARYFGEAGQGSGATAALAEAIGALANNLDTIIPLLAAVAAGIGANMAASAVAGSRAMFALTAVMGGAATAAEGLTFALAGLQRAVPVLAITALIAVLTMAALKSREGAKANQEYATQLENSKQASQVAADAANTLATATGAARNAAMANAKALREETIQLLANAKAATAAAIAKRQQVISENREKIQAATRTTRNVGGGIDSVITQQRMNAGALQQAQANIWAAVQAEGELNKSLYKLDQAISGTPAVGSAPAASSDKKTRTPKGPTGPSAEEIAQRQEQELSRLRQERLRAEASLAGTAEERAAIERELLTEEYQARRADIENNTDLSQQQKDAQVEILNELYGAQKAVKDGKEIVVATNTSLYAQQIAREEQLAEIERQSQVQGELADAEERILRSQLDLTEDRIERAKLEHDILDIQHRQEVAELEALLKKQELVGATEEEIAATRRRIAAADAAYQNAEKSIDKANQSPLERYRDKLDKTDTELRDDAEQLIVDEIEHVRGGMRDAISKALGTDDPLITGLIDLLLEQILFKPLADALANANAGGGGGMGGLLSGLGSVFGSIFGRASGGSVNAGQVYRVNEGASPGRVEAFRPSVSGDIIPLGRMNALQSGGAQPGGVVRLVIEEAPGFAARVRAEATGVAVEVQRATAPKVIEASVNETLRRSNRRTL